MRRIAKTPAESASAYGDVISEWRLQHMRLEIDDVHRRNLREGPPESLRRIRRRGVLVFSDAHLQAAERLRDDFDRAGLAPRIVGSYTIGVDGSSGIATMTDAMLDARTRATAAIHMAPPVTQGVLWRAVCLCEPLGHIERSLGLARQSAAVLLARALDAIGEFYGCT